MLVYFLSLNSPLWNSLDSQLFNYVSKNRQKKILRYVHTLDQKLSLYAALIIRLGLSRLTGTPPDKLLFSSSSNRKPSCISLPDCDFSLSHTHNLILCCIAKGHRVGADVERICNTPFDIMPLVFHPEEIQYIKSSVSEEQNLRFFKIWTQKEAYIKLIGRGFSYDTTSFNTLLPPFSSNNITWKYDSYMCSVCLENPISFSPIKLSENDIYDFFINNQS